MPRDCTPRDPGDRLPYHPPAPEPATPPRADGVAVEYPAATDGDIVHIADPDVDRAE